MKIQRRWVIQVLLVISAIAVGWNLVVQVRLILSQTPNSWIQDQSADCAVVLTGSQGRVREGFDLLAQKLIRKLIIAGVHPTAPLREIFPQWPFYGDLSEEDVILDRRSQTTWGNAQQTLPIVEALSCKSVLLVTSRYHAFRATRTFRSVYSKEIPVEARIIPSSPGGGSIQHAQEIFVEAVKGMFYSLWAY